MALPANEVVASLEGMKIIAKERTCELHLYDFEVNSWQLVEINSRPMPRASAEQWVNGWNRIDRFAALTLLIQPESD